MFKCFESPDEVDQMDLSPFKLKHKLAGHPSLSLESLAKIIPELQPHQVMFSKGLSDLGINFDRAHIDHKNGLGLEETFEKLKTTSSYIAVKNPEYHPAFQNLFKDLVDDVSAMMKIRGSGDWAIEPTLWLFIASPNAMTPFHFDRYSNFLLQIRGSKEVAVFPPLDLNVISAGDYEAYMDKEESKPLWRPEIEPFGKKFDIIPGDTIHIPYTSGHYVKNGSSDISITLSIFFQTNETLRLTRAMRVNHRLRKRIQKVGMAPTFVGKNRALDSFKSTMLPVADLIGGAMGTLRKKRILNFT